MIEVKLPVILHLSQDDPRKCTARKLQRLGLAHLERSPRRIPRGALLLDPFSGTALSPADRENLLERGIIAVDCSWERAEEVFRSVLKDKRLEGRTLPMLLAANPTKFGKWGELSTLEALAAAYYILGEKDRGKRLLSAYNWGMRFLETNLELLESYARCRNSAEVVKVQSDFY